MPSTRLITSICREFNVSEEWIMTGNGEKHPPKTKTQQLAEFMNDVIEAPEGIKATIINHLLELDVEDWEALDRMIRKHWK